MKTIEFTGLPGSGKSALLPIIKIYLKKKGFKVFDSSDLFLSTKHILLNNGFFRVLLSSFPQSIQKIVKIKFSKLANIDSFYQLRYIKEHFDIFSYVYRWNQQRTIPESHKMLIINWLIKLGGIYQLAYESLNKNSYLILDDGFVQKVISFFVSIEEEIINLDEIDVYLNKIHKVDILFRIETPKKTCLNRMKLRGYPKRLKGCSLDKIDKYLSNSETAIHHAVRILSGKKTKIIEINNSQNHLSEESIYSQIPSNLIWTN